MMDNQEIFLYFIWVTLTALECLIYTYTSIYMQIDTQYVQVRTSTYIYIHFVLSVFSANAIDIRADTCIYLHILTYTYIYVYIHENTYVEWKGVNCGALPVPCSDSDSVPPGPWHCLRLPVGRWPLTGHRSPAASGPGRLGGGWACHWPCRRAASGLPLSVTGRPPWRRTNEWKNWAYQADPILWQCQLSSTGLCI
jgi:hypothetical protein